MMVKPVKTLELHYTMIQYLIIPLLTTYLVGVHHQSPMFPDLVLPRRENDDRFWENKQRRVFSLALFPSNCMVLHPGGNADVSLKPRLLKKRVCLRRYPPKIRSICLKEEFREQRITINVILWKYEGRTSQKLLIWRHDIGAHGNERH